MEEQAEHGAHERTAGTEAVRALKHRNPHAPFTMIPARPTA